MPRFSLPKLRSTRERSVDSRKTTRSGQSASQSSSRANSNKANSRSVSVPPQQRKIVNTSTSSVTASSNSRSVATTKTETRDPNLRAAGLSHEISDGALNNNSKASYTFAQDLLPPTNERQMSYESDANISTASTTDEFVTSLDRSPPKLEDMFLEAGAFGRSNSKASSSAQNGINNTTEYDDPPDIIPSLEEDEPNDYIHHHHDAYQSDMFSVNTELTDPTSFKHFSEQWTAFDSNKPKEQPRDAQPILPTQSDSPPYTRQSKNPRLVSPSPSRKEELKSSGWESADPFDTTTSSWMTGQEECPKDNKAEASTKRESFGANFFSTGFETEFDKDGTFFGGGEWNTDNKDNTTNDMMWDSLPQFFEEKKDDQIRSSHAPTAKSSQKDTSTLRDPPSISETPEYPGWSISTTAMDSSKQDQDNALCDVMSSSSSSRKVSHTTSTSSSIQKGHRRVPSNESSASQQQFHRSRKGGGSVCSSRSNSSAVDQILESYRQKRLFKQQRNGTLNVPSNSHRKTPSNESLSQRIGNLEHNFSVQGQDGISSVSRVQQQIQHFNQSPQHQQYNTSPKPSTGRVSPQSSISYSRASGTYQPNLNAAVNEISDRLRTHRVLHSANDDSNSPINPSSDSDQFLLANIEATLGSCGVAPDLDSLSGRSNRSRSSQFRGRSSPRSHSMQRTSSRADISVASFNSRTSRNSFRSYRSNISQSALSHMSKESRSVANDLFRLEAQLADVERQQNQPLENPTEESFSNVVCSTASSNSSSRSNLGNALIGAAPVPRSSSLVEVVAPPGKLGILLANKVGFQGPTHISAVRSESVLAGKVHVGDRFVSIDGEDVSGMNSREITSVMARKADFRRVIVFVPVRTGRAQDNCWI